MPSVIRERERDDIPTLKREGYLVCFAPLFLVARADDLYR
jgi:hypothetical protein